MPILNIQCHSCLQATPTPMPPARKDTSISASRRAALSRRAAAQNTTASHPTTATSASSTTKRSKAAKRSTTAKRPTTAKSSTTSKKSGAAARRAKSKQNLIEDLAQDVVKYTRLFQTIAESMWCDPNELQAAHERQYNLWLEGRANRTNEWQTDEQIQQLLDDLAAQCESIPEAFDDRVRVAFAAHAYAQTLLDHVIAHPSRSFSDRLVIIRRITAINQEALGLPPPSADLPRLVKLIPDAPVTRPVAVEDVEAWRTHPKALLRKAFICHEAIRRVFFVADYYVKEIGGHRYEVRFEDSGPDVFTFSLDEMLLMVAGTELVTNL
ncbi:hypothetical protein Hypma_005556 [Hypsizygus marmoreus]|uniref:Uncharacterized protein n=1 Tax=Hypsizygus marmoreus TaxID=39966 RepID=A0A369JWD5_HYPMA|nr:hypothetical protein Hypma_005556 [Hypsizygus marmoreus]